MHTSLELYDKIEKLRIQQGISVADLNRKAGISHGTLPSWKNRGTMPKLEVLHGLCEALGISIISLLFDVDADKFTSEELELLTLWRKISSEQQKAALLTMIKSVIAD